MNYSVWCKYANGLVVREAVYDSEELANEDVDLQEFDRDRRAANGWLPGRIVDVWVVASED